ncbi:MAG: acyl-CoA thioesterase [Desulfurococcales archaeon]|nr:acyl-CoA thioesterase [Desulfurococcales archaeon]
MGSCNRILRVRDTVLETVNQVNPSHTNPLGILHGGVALRWMILAATMAAMRVARGYTVLARLDNVFFLKPVTLGDLAVVTSWVEYVGRSSLELTVVLESEKPSGERHVTTVSHLTMVAVDETLRPRSVGACISPQGREEEELYSEAERRREARPSKPERTQRALDTSLPKPLVPGYSLSSHRIANPEDSLAYNVVDASKLMHVMDELAAITAMKYARGIVVTASIDATDFYVPIRVGEILGIHSALTYVGRSSLEVTVKVLKDNIGTGETSHAATSYFTLVHVDREGRSLPVREPRHETSASRDMIEEARRRRAARMERLSFIRNRLEELMPIVSRIRGSPP